jgi:hypothetical protein
MNGNTLAGRGMLPRPQGFGAVRQHQRQQNVGGGVTYPVTHRCKVGIHP